MQNLVGKKVCIESVRYFHNSNQPSMEWYQGVVDQVEGYMVHLTDVILDPKKAGFTKIRLNPHWFNTVASTFVSITETS